MTTEELKKAIEIKINEIDNLKLELTKLVFANQQVIEDDGCYPAQNGYIGSYKVETKKKVLRFAVNEKGWLTTFDNYMAGLEELPGIKEFVILNENKRLKKEVDQLKEYITSLQESAI